MDRRARLADPQDVGPNFDLVTIVDVNNVDFNDGSEPSIAVNPANTNFIVVHGSFSDWGSAGQDDARPLFRAMAALLEPYRLDRCPAWRDAYVRAPRHYAF